MKKLKFEGLKVGQIIKAYDHQPRSWMEKGQLIETDFYVIGRIIKVLHNHPGMFGDVKVYKVRVLKDTTFEENPREEVFVPIEVAATDWEGRVTVVPETPNEEAILQIAEGNDGWLTDQFIVDKGSELGLGDDEIYKALWTLADRLNLYNSVDIELTDELLLAGERPLSSALMTSPEVENRYAWFNRHELH